MDSVQDTLLIGSNQPTHNNQPYLVSLATIIYRRGEARCDLTKPLFWVLHSRHARRIMGHYTWTTPLLWHHFLYLFSIHIYPLVKRVLPLRDLIYVPVARIVCTRQKQGGCRRTDCREVYPLGASPHSSFNLNRILLACLVGWLEEYDKTGYKPK